MKDWYLRQSPRDRIIVLAVGLLCLLGGAYLFIVSPLQSGLENRRQQVENKKDDLRYMVNSAELVSANGGAAPTGVRQSTKAPYLLIDEIIRKAKIELPERVEPTGADGARVQFSEVNFDKLVQVIAELELYGLSLSTLNITAKNIGTVSARFTMSRS